MESYVELKIVLTTTALEVLNRSLASQKESASHHIMEKIVRRNVFRKAIDAHLLENKVSGAISGLAEISDFLRFLQSGMVDTLMALSS